MNVITQEELSQYRQKNTRRIECSDGTTRDVFMSPSMWIHYEFVKAFEPLTDEQLRRFALERMRHEACDFNTAFQMIVAYFTRLWKDV